MKGGRGGERETTATVGACPDVQTNHPQDYAQMSLKENERLISLIVSFTIPHGKTRSTNLELDIYLDRSKASSVLSC